MTTTIKFFKSIVYLCAILSLLWFSTANAATRVVNLTVDYKTVNLAGESVKAMAINNQIPAPTLHFKQGDHVIINVYNRLDKGTSIHWHGLLVPWKMDGVEGITQPPIPPGGVFRYEFTLNQSGTYWYHAHSDFQEQQGLYGGIIIDPPKPTPFRYTKDYVIVLSDWSNSAPEQIYANLKKSGDYYSQKFPMQPSLTRFLRDYSKGNAAQRQKLIGDYKMMQQMRMSIYDFSDVAYDAYLLNGRSKANPWSGQVKVGDVVRLRFVGATGNTIYNVKIPGTMMQVVHVQGNDVQPYPIKEFTIAPGETFDVLVKIQKDSPYIIYAESIDSLGKAYGALVTQPNQVVNYNQVTPFPEPQPATMGHDMHGMDHGSMMHGDASHDMMNMDSHDQTMSKGVSQTTGTKYQNLKSPYKTNDPNKPVQVIKMALSGYMGRYIWFINGVPEYEAKPVMIEPGKRYRIIFTNDSMMNHPMHLHGHWFILRNGHGDHDPLVHTVMVPPGATVVVDFDANDPGRWLLHCHLLFHMMAGMSRVVEYTNLNQEGHAYSHQQSSYSQVNGNTIPASDPNAHLMAHTPGLYRASFLDIGEDPFDNLQKVTFKTLFGGDYNKLELLMREAEVQHGVIENADLDIFYWHLIDQFWAIKGGVNYFYRPSGTPYWQPGIGIEGLMPYFIDTDARLYYHDGSFKLDLELSRDTQITNNFFIRVGARGILASKTVSSAGLGAGLNELEFTVRPYYRLTPALSIFAEFEHQEYYGATRNIVKNLGEPVNQNFVTFGLSVLF